jgi:hypothetical protein
VAKLLEKSSVVCRLAFAVCVESFAVCARADKQMALEALDRRVQELAREEWRLLRTLFKDELNSDDRRAEALFP